MTDDSYIKTGPAGTTFAGHDATRLYAAVTVRRAIDLYLKTGMRVNRAYTPTNMRAFAANVTGKTYPRGKRGLEAARDDLHQWIEAMKAALPIERAP